MKHMDEEEKVKDGHQEVKVQKEQEKNTTLDEIKQDANQLKEQIKKSAEIAKELSNYKEIKERTQSIINELGNGKLGEYKNIAKIKGREALYIQAGDIDTNKYINQYSSGDLYLNRVLTYSKILENLLPYKDSLEKPKDGEYASEMFGNSSQGESFKKRYESYKQIFDKLVNGDASTNKLFYERYIVSIGVYNQKCEQKIKSESSMLKGKLVNMNDVLSTYKKVSLKSQNNNLSQQDIKEYERITNLVGGKENLGKLTDQEFNFNMIKEDFYSINQKILEFSNGARSYSPLVEFELLLTKLKSPTFSLNERYHSVIMDQGSAPKEEITGD